MERIRKRIHLRNIVTTGTNVRMLHKDHLKALTANMKVNGLLNPIVCTKQKPGAKRVYIVDGFFRLKAYKILNNKRPPSRRRKTIDTVLIGAFSEVIMLNAQG